MVMINRDIYWLYLCFTNALFRDAWVGGDLYGVLSYESVSMILEHYWLKIVRIVK